MSQAILTEHEHFLILKNYPMVADFLIQLISILKIPLRELRGDWENI